MTAVLRIWYDPLVGEKLRVAVIGAGGIGRHHAARAAHYGAAVVAVHDARLDAARELAAQHGALATDRLDELFDQRLDLAIVATPPTVRLEPIRRACDRRVHLLIEKPPALTVAEARECSALIDRAGVLAGCGFQLRYGSAFEKLRDMLAGETVHVARSLLCTNYYLNPATKGWYLQKQHSGGSLFEQGVHPLDAVRYVLGDARCVRAGAFAVKNMAADRPEYDSENSVQVAYELDNGVFGTHLNHCGTDYLDMNFEFIGPKVRLITIGWGNGSIKGLYRGKEIKEPVTEESRLGVDKTGAMLRAIETGDRSLVRSPFADAVHTVELLEAATRGARAGRFVRVDELAAVAAQPA